MIIENKKKWSIFLILLIFLPSFLLADQGQCQRGGWIYPNYEKGVFDPFESFNSGLSYINISGGLELNPDGSITLSVPLTQFEALALYKQFAPSFQVFFSPSFSNSTFETILSSDVTTATCAENLARFVFDYRFAIDGIIFDWEPGSTLPPADQQQRYVCLCKQISKEFPDFFIPVRAFFDQRPRTDQFKITELSYVLDAFELQSYQLAFPGTGLQLTIDKWLELGLNPKQILLGIGITSTESSNVYIGENPKLPGSSFFFRPCTQGRTLSWLDMTEILKTNPNSQLVQSGIVVDYIWVETGPCECMTFHNGTSSCGCGNIVFPSHEPCFCEPNTVCGSAFYYNTIQELYIFSSLVLSNRLRGVFSFTFDQDSPNFYVTQRLC